MGQKTDFSLAYSDHLTLFLSQHLPPSVHSQVNLQPASRLGVCESHERPRAWRLHREQTRPGKGKRDALRLGLDRPVQLGSAEPC